MIFVSVGTQFPFDRLVRVVDDWAVDADRDDVLAQVGDTRLVPRKLRAAPFLTADVCNARLREAELVVCHAGMGTVLTCLKFGTPVIVMPRRMSENEHRNDHQLDTVSWMRHVPGVQVVEDAEALRRALDHFSTGTMTPGHVGNDANPDLLNFLRAAIHAPARDDQARPLRRQVAGILSTCFRWVLARPTQVGSPPRCAVAESGALPEVLASKPPAAGSAVSSAA